MRLSYRGRADEPSEVEIAPMGVARIAGACLERLARSWRMPGMRGTTLWIGIDVDPALPAVKGPVQ